MTARRVWLEALADSTAPSGTLQLPARPVSRLHTETAIAQAAGIAELAEMGVEVYGPSLRAAADVARAAADRFTERLRTEVLPRSEGEGTLRRASL